MLFIDLETTGATATVDRITEIGIVELTDQGETRYSQLVNPQTRIPENIQRLTGIRQEMVEDAPTFEEIAQTLLARLDGRLFVAHNARFDYGFVKNEFRRIGIDFRATVLCTVKLSRALYPQEPRHNLDVLIERHGLVASGRHRALADADLICQFWKKLSASIEPSVLEQTVAMLTARPSLPSHLDPDLVDQLPTSHGVYIFYGENDSPLYVGKSNNLRKRVLSHFSGDHARGKDMSLSLQVRRVDWIETAGEIAALLKESELVKKLLPSHNMRLRRNKELCSWRLSPGAEVPELVWARDLSFGRQPDLYGCFKSQRDAKAMLSDLAQAEKLCKRVLGLEGTRPQGPCFGFQLGQCRGACAGKESERAHHLRLIAALSRHRLPEWPHDGAIGIREADTIHVIDAWCYLGSAKSESDLHDILDSGRPAFDLDVYKILRKALRDHSRIVSISVLPSISL